jgi:hypothetical protein
MTTLSKGAEVSLVAYNGNAKSAKAEGFITGEIVKITSKYIHIKNYIDGSIWKSVR